MPTSRAFFDAIAPRYDREFAFSGAEIRRRLGPLLRVLDRPCRILDLGIGTGRELAPLLDAGHDVVGIDASAAMIVECNKRARPVRIAQGDFYEPLPWDVGSFDAVIALHGTLAHPPGPAAHRALFAEIARVLRPRGSLWFEVPHEGFLAAAARLGHVVTGDSFEAHDVRSGARLTGVVWPRARWEALLPAAFTVRAAPAPSPFEIAVHATAPERG